MSRAFILALAAIVIVIAVLSGGCARDRSEEIADTNNTTEATGHVFLEGKAIAGAQVEAVSVDGTHRVSNRTNESGDYVLSLRPHVWYRVSATAQGLKHTVWPVFVSNDSYRKNGYDISLARVLRTEISGAPAGDSKWKSNGTYITAAPADGSAPITTITGDDGRYSIEVKPDMYYSVSGASYDYRGAGGGGVPINYRNTIGCSKVRPGKDETVLLDYTNRLETAPALVVNGIVGLAKVSVSPPQPQPSGLVPAIGHVYMNGSPVKGASIEALSVDGADRVSAVTNESGAYVLAIEPGVQYKVTARYRGLKHTLNSLSATQDTPGGINDINLTATPVSEIIVSYGASYGYTDNRLLIEAVPSDGGMPVVALANGYGRYSLEVRPGVKYSLGGRSYDSFGQKGSVFTSYPKDNPGSSIMLAPDETLLAHIDVMFHHGPKNIGFYRDPVTGAIDPFKPPVPVTVTGHVYLDNKTVSGARVDVLPPSFSAEKIASTVTNESGAYSLTIDSRSQRTLSASYNGLSRSIWPVIVQDNTTGVYDINITWTTLSMITGALDQDQGWLARPGNVIKAVPAGGDKAITAVTGGDGRYSLYVKPFTYYDISGQCQAPDGRNYSLNFHYSNGVSCEGFMLRENETVFVDYYPHEYRA